MTTSLAHTKYCHWSWLKLNAHRKTKGNISVNMLRGKTNLDVIDLIQVAVAQTDHMPFSLILPVTVMGHLFAVSFFQKCLIEDINPKISNK